MPTLAQQKKKLETEKAELERKLKEADARVSQAEAAADEALARAENVEAALSEIRQQTATHGHAAVPQPRQGAVHEQAPQEPTLLYDPFDSKNPHKIVKHPPGFRLGWKNPMYRENHRGWRGWVPVKYDSDVGRNLKSYLLDPPRKMAHQDDDMVRRGDSILCMLPEDMWLARQQDRVDRANRNRTAHARDLQTDRATVQDVENGPKQTHAPGSVGGRTMTS